MRIFDSPSKSLFGIYLDSQQVLAVCGPAMARPKTNSKKVPVTLPSSALATLDSLVGRKFHGESRSEVACHLLITALDDLIEKGRVKEVKARVLRKKR